MKRTLPTIDAQGVTALIYCRVSSKKQEREGDGLASQETRLRDYCARMGYSVSQVFRDKVTGSESQRPGLRAMLAFIEKGKPARFRIVFDHLDRFTRDFYLHADLRRTIAKLGAILETPAGVLDERSSSRLMENVTVAFADYHRINNREQTLNRMQARVSNGFAIFAAPSGYTYGRVPGFNGRMLVPQEPQASVVREAFERYVSRQLESQADVVRFLEEHPLYPKPKDGRIPHQRVGDMLRNPIYAGYVEAPCWGIERRKGHHQPLISYETFQRVQDRLNGLRMSYRTDLSQDFPLRSFVLCDDCERPLTACWSISGCAAKKRHPYYQCAKKGCASYGKTIRRGVIEGEFEAILKTAEPQPQMLDLATAMLKELWQRKQVNVATETKALKASLAAIEEQIDQAVERIVETTVPAVMRALEEKVQRLESDKLLLREKIETAATPRGDFDRRVRTGLAFVASPWNLWSTGQIEDRRAVLKLTFAHRLRYKRGEGFRTPEMTLPFKVLGDFFSGEMGMARPKGFEPLTPRFVVWCSIQLSYGRLTRRRGLGPPV
jgi:site-specific DNA recombinase